MKEAVKHIHAGEIVAYPTESCFGLGCDPNNEQAVTRLLALKKRPKHKGLILIADKIERLTPWIQWSLLTQGQQTKILATWPGAVTWLVKTKDSTPQYLRGDHETLAVRIPGFKSMIKLCELAKSAIVSTSANVSGAESLKTAQQVSDQFGGEIDYIVDQPIQGNSQPSQIFDALNGHRIR